MGIEFFLIYQKGQLNKYFFHFKNFHKVLMKKKFE